MLTNASFVGPFSRCREQEEKFYCYLHRVRQCRIFSAFVHLQFVSGLHPNLYAQKERTPRVPHSSDTPSDETRPIKCVK